MAGSRGAFLVAFLLLLSAAAAQRVVTLAGIEHHPAAYDGRRVVLVGYTWSWFSKTRPAACEDVPPARDNVMRTRSDGYFCDGTRVAFLPPGRDVNVLAGPGERHGALQLVARVHAGPEGWWLEPLELR
ncbi:hypothetical protein [Oceanithermus desulfurans]|uniref:Uncharacterized protein n=2 Tax=Oceanithermus desulfurans TaxID=227924 RepID=A0A511RJD9_9DEIN|nr:hypothetical protein [Oceanithermus desulfurans]MBB6029300.1 hypothetical protein [Oceanithermus desulfurans]GEM89062.1 hypothetical protein ODE01S_04960 [Oceanithermus desulfurans NBRC 100063]